MFDKIVDMKIYLLLCVLSVFAVVPCAHAQDLDTVVYNARKNFIYQFVETYKEAYAKQDLAYIEDVFSDDAIIITETDIVRTDDSYVNAVFRVKSKNEYRHIIENKSEYLKRLKKVFKDNIAIRLSVANVKIYPHKDYHDLYGLSFLQTWKALDNSSLLLEDDNPGYVFMMIDFKNGDNCPLLHIRTWQPDKHIKKDSDIYNLYDFIIL